MNWKFLLIITWATTLMSSCSVAPAQFDFGKDQCHFCKMNIVEQQHMAQYVTKKGKAFKFDAIECMVNDINANNISEQDLAFILVADYSAPGKLTDAQSATFIISPAINSPMGANLTGFKLEANAVKVLQSAEGQMYSWEALKKHMR